MTERHQVRAPRNVFAIGMLAAAIMLFVAGEAVAQRRGGGRGGGRGAGRGSVRHSSARRSPARRGGGRATAARRPAARRPAARRRAPVRRGAHRRAVNRRHDRRYSAWKDARRDYYRFRTINHALRLGVYVATLPRTYSTVVVSGSTYYYGGGVYYARSGSRYVVVSSPPGAVVYAVPTHTTVVYVDSTPYYYYGGTYYVVTTEPAPQPTVVVDASATSVKESYPSYAHTGQASGSTDAGAAQAELPPMTEDEDSYKVVAPPIGATVPYLPDEADSETVNGKKYYVYEDTYYRPFSSEGDTVYMVVDDPRG